MVENTVPIYCEVCKSLNLYENLALEPRKPSERQCNFCDGMFLEIAKILKLKLTKISNFEFKSYNIRVSFAPNLTKKSIYKKLNLNFDDKILRTLVKNQIGNVIEQKFGNIEISNYPDMLIKVHFISIHELNLSVQLKSVYIYGRYRKFSREIPQTKWPCRKCKGKGCRNCGQTGLQYKLSVEQIISHPFESQTKYTSSSFHGAGREDIDAKMLGEGRPFVLELKNPTTRNMDLELIERQINASNIVSVNSLEFCDRKKIKELKELSQFNVKEYRALIKLTNELDLTKLSKIKEIKYPLQINQATPRRVLHRRVDKIRHKDILKIEILKYDPKTLEVLIKAQGGTYIKEFISGDNSRTIPNLSEIINNEAVCTELDVTYIGSTREFALN